MKIKKVEKTVYVGASGREFGSEDAARKSLVLERLAEMLDNAAYSYEYDTQAAAEYLLDKRAEVITLLGGADL